MSFSKKFYEHKEWNIERYSRIFVFRKVDVTVQFRVDRVIRKYFWGMVKTDTLIYSHNFGKMAPMLINLMPFSDYGKVKLLIDKEILEMKIRTFRK